MSTIAVHEFDWDGEWEDPREYRLWDPEDIVEFSELGDEDSVPRDDPDCYFRTR